MERYEYRIERVRVGASGTGHELLAALDRFGEDGWRVVDGAGLDELAQSGAVTVLLGREVNSLRTFRRLMMPLAD
ncbi:MAG: hypothetical protein M0Z49_12805 [Chloroflexi bacterium]|nr:hypothetical protein [Chloroflexota bacterium]